MKKTKFISILWFSLSLAMFVTGLAQNVVAEDTPMIPSSAYVPQTSYIEHFEQIRITSNDDWFKLADTYKWCSGTGTEKDPFIIDGIFMDALIFNRTCLYIEDTDVYFIIQNSVFEYSLRNSIDDFYTSGIFLNHVSNGMIINNNLSYNFHGISMYHCLNMFVAKNTMSNTMNLSTGKAILVWNGYYNYIGENDITNHYDGICAWYSVNNTISKNIVTNDEHESESITALVLIYCNDTLLSENTLAGINGTFSGIEDVNGVDNLFLSNVGFSSKAKSRGISLTNSNNNKILKNTCILLGENIYFPFQWIFIYMALVCGVVGVVLIAFEHKIKFHNILNFMFI